MNVALHDDEPAPAEPEPLPAGAAAEPAALPDPLPAAAPDPTAEPADGTGVDDEPAALPDPEDAEPVLGLRMLDSGVVGFCAAWSALASCTYTRRSWSWS